MIEEIAQYLDDEEFGTYESDGTDGNIFLHTLPESPIEAVAIINYACQPVPCPLGQAREYYQIIVRSPDPRACYTLIKGIQDSLDGIHGQTLITDGAYVNNISTISCGYVGIDESKNHLISLNLLVDYQKTRNN